MSLVLFSLQTEQSHKLRFHLRARSLLFGNEDLAVQVFLSQDNVHRVKSCKIFFFFFLIISKM